MLTPSDSNNGSTTDVSKRVRVSSTIASSAVVRLFSVVAALVMTLPSTLLVAGLYTFTFTLEAVPLSKVLGLVCATRVR